MKYVVMVSLMPGFHHSVAVPRSAVAVSTCRCAVYLPFRSNRIESYFFRSVVGGQPISVLVYSSLGLCIRKDVFSIFVLTRNGNGSLASSYERKNRNGTTERHNSTKERQNGTGTAKRQRRNGNRMVETRHYVVRMV